jgi:cytochrome c-type biogenesis protein
VLGMAVVYVITGAVVGSLGYAVARYAPMISRVLGVVIIILGLIFAGVLRIGQRDLRITRVPVVGVAAAPVLGAVFALGWTPCIGPTLGVVLNLALNEATAIRGMLLMFVFTLGLGLPFIVAGLAYTKMARTVGFVRRHQIWVLRFGGLVMVVVGLLLVTGWWDHLMAALRQFASGFTPVI